MKLCTVTIFIIIVYPFILHACPTCIGLPRPGERPFFERSTFIPIIKNTGLKQPAQKQLPLKSDEMKK